MGGFMSKYDVLLFDLDDTLINNTENARYAFKKMLLMVNKEYNDESFQRWLELDKQFWIDYANKKIIVPDEYKILQN
jgi:FMN phosphatase YigB (HAD superfamily)